MQILNGILSLGFVLYSIFIIKKVIEIPVKILVINRIKGKLLVRVGHKAIGS